MKHVWSTTAEVPNIRILPSLKAEGCNKMQLPYPRGQIKCEWKSMEKAGYDNKLNWKDQ